MIDGSGEMGGERGGERGVSSRRGECAREGGEEGRGNESEGEGPEGISSGRNSRPAP